MSNDLQPRPANEIIDPMQPQEAPPPAPDPEAARKVEKIAKVLGVDPNDEEALRAAFESLFRPLEQARASARLRLTDRERRSLKAKGIDPAKYLAIKNSIAARSGRPTR